MVASVGGMLTICNPETDPQGGKEEEQGVAACWVQRCSQEDEKVLEMVVVVAAQQCQSI